MVDAPGVLCVAGQATIRRSARSDPSRIAHAGFYQLALCEKNVMRRASDLAAEEISPAPSVQTRMSRGTGYVTKPGAPRAVHVADRARRRPGAVTDSRFRMHGVRRLRVSDASVLPCILRFFIVTAAYMLAEKASEVILPRPTRKAQE